MLLFFALQQEGSLCAQHCLNALLQGTVPANADREQCVKCLTYNLSLSCKEDPLTFMSRITFNSKPNITSF